MPNNVFLLSFFWCAGTRLALKVNWGTQTPEPCPLVADPLGGGFYVASRSLIPWNSAIRLLPTNWPPKSRQQGAGSLAKQYEVSESLFDWIITWDQFIDSQEKTNGGGFHSLLPLQSVKYSLCPIKNYQKHTKVCCCTFNLGFWVSSQTPWCVTRRLQ